jgi:hypothetical protein
MEDPKVFEHIAFDTEGNGFIVDSYCGIYEVGESICSMTLPCLGIDEKRSEKEVYNALLKHPVLAIGMARIAQTERNYCAQLELELYRDEQIKEMLKILSRIETILSKRR